MSDAPWQGDACSLIDAFRSGQRSPVEETEACLRAIEASSLNAFSFVDGDRALDQARAADVTKPFGGLPVGIKELEPVEGWPYTEASLVFKDRKATYSSTVFERLTGDGGAVPLGQTTASEFGGLNVSVTRINGVTHNPWKRGHTAGGSSGGSASAVAGGLVPLATGGDGGGSIRIPAGYNGLLGMKGTYGRIPRGPHTMMRPHTVVLGCLARSVRDAARYYDVCAGYDPGDPTSLPGLPTTGGWEAALGSHDLAGLEVMVDPTLGGVPLHPGVEERILEAAAALIEGAGMKRVEGHVELPRLAGEWAMGNLATLMADIGDRWPACARDLTEEMAIGMQLSESLYNVRVAAAAETTLTKANDAMADAFRTADLIICATNPDPAFPAEASMSSSAPSFVDRAKGNEAARWVWRRIMTGVRMSTGVAPTIPTRLLSFAASRFPDLINMGALTMVSNMCGNPAVSIPAGTVDGLPVGMQVLTRHHADALLFDVALHVERETPWPLVAAAAPV